jgi:TonB family protein
MTPLAWSISRALIHFVWQGSIIGLSLWAVLFALKKRSPNSRYIASCAALALLAMAPVVTTWVFYTHPAGTVASAPATIVSESAAPNAVPVAVRQSLRLEWLQSWTLPVWSLGVFAFSGRLLLGYKHAFLLRRRGKPASDSITGVVVRLARSMAVRRPVRVLISAMADSPSVVGWLRPVILLPASALMGLTPLQLEAILAHEIGHIKRYDYLVNIGQMAIETLLFYHPAVWWTSKRIRLERELCCDDLAVGYSGNALRYARALTTLEKLRLRAPAVAMASTGGSLMYRIQRLVGVRTKEYGLSRMPAVIAMGLGMMCLALNVNWLKGQDAQGVKVDLGASSVIHRTPVLYPESAQKQGITGTVQLEVKLDSSGNVSDARVLSGPDELRKAALESVLKWHFTSDAARGTRQITISFSADGKQVEVREPRQQQKTATPITGAEDSLRLFEGAIRDNEKALASTLLPGNLTRRQQLEREIGALRAEAAKVEAQSRPQLEVRIQELRKELDATPFVRPATVLTNLSGRQVQRINTSELPESVRADLLSRLPIREGDTLSQESLEQTMKAIRSFDEHLVFDVLRIDENSVELRIVPPNSKR